MKICEYCRGTGKLGFQQESCCFCDGVGMIKEQGEETHKNNNVPKCSICGKDIYISESHKDYACADINCPLGQGAKLLMNKIFQIFMLHELLK